MPSLEKKVEVEAKESAKKKEVKKVVESSSSEEESEEVEDFSEEEEIPEKKPVKNYREDRKKLEMTLQELNLLKKYNKVNMK